MSLTKDNYVYNEQADSSEQLFKEKWRCYRTNKDFFFTYNVNMHKFYNIPTPKYDGNIKILINQLSLSY